ncbi:MAG: hypothetical protein ACYSTY_11180 [Planctomycetota bacterium]
MQGPLDDKGPPDDALSSRELIGSWNTTSGQESLVISIREDGQALVLFIQPGQHSIKHVAWKPFHGGILIEDVTRIRLWPGRHAGELRAELEVDPARTSGERKLPPHFFMARVTERPVPAELNRPVPPHWRRTQVDEAWDASAGRR